MKTFLITIFAITQTINAQPTNSTYNWTSKDGKTIKAKFLHAEPFAVVVEKNREKITIPFEKLAPESIELAKELHYKLIENDAATDNNSNDISTGRDHISEKLRRIIIPRIDFEDTTVEEAIDFLRMRSAELDNLELDPTRKGVNFVVRRPRVTQTAAPDAGLDAGAAEALPSASADPGTLRIRELRVRNVPLAVALKYICDEAKLRYKVDDFCVTLMPIAESSVDIYTRSFSVPADFAWQLESSTGYSGDGHKPIVELLKRIGIIFSKGTDASLSNSGVLLVTNTSTELDKIEAVVDNISKKKLMKNHIKFRLLQMNTKTADSILNEIKAGNNRDDELGKNIDAQIKSKEIKLITELNKENARERFILKPEEKNLSLQIEAEPHWIESGNIFDLRARAEFAQPRDTGLLSFMTQTTIISNRWHLLSRWGDSKKDTLLVIYGGTNSPNTPSLPDTNNQSVDEYVTSDLIMDAILLETTAENLSKVQSVPAAQRTNGRSWLIERSKILASATSRSRSGNENVITNSLDIESHQNMPHGPGLHLRWEASWNSPPHSNFISSSSNQNKTKEEITKQIRDEKISLKLTATYVSDEKKPKLINFDFRSSELQDKIPEFITPSGLNAESQKVIVLMITPWYEMIYANN